ncbi:MAG TPA: hypothetical protein DCG12_09625 [Planctomycetaceae bacterium]|nr:hypothetical protein [Planctomycetaceae bacterium]
MIHQSTQSHGIKRQTGSFLKIDDHELFMIPLQPRSRLRYSGTGLRRSVAEPAQPPHRGHSVIQTAHSIASEKTTAWVS